MEGDLNTCTLTSKKYNYNQMIKELENHYGFDKIGEGGFGVVLGAKSCAIKVIKDIKRCEELFPVEKSQIPQREHQAGLYTRRGQVDTE